jgi:hypothetical protein
MDALCYPQEARLAHPSWDDQLVVKVLPSPRKLEYVLIASYRLIASCSASRIGWVSLRDFILMSMSCGRCWTVRLARRACGVASAARQNVEASPVWDAARSTGVVPNAATHTEVRYRKGFIAKACSAGVLHTSTNSIVSEGIKCRSEGI